MRYPKNHKAKNPNKDVVIIYESGGRDIENPYSGDALEALEDESEGSFEVDVRNLERNDEGGYPKDQEKSGIMMRISVDTLIIIRKRAHREVKDIPPKKNGGKRL